MKFSKRKKRIPPPGEWLALSLTASVLGSSIMWYLHGAWWGIAEFILAMAVLWAKYYNDKCKYAREENDV